MEKQFATYEISLAMKELGFDEECFGYYRNDNKFFYFGEDSRVQKDSILSPIWQQCIDWFIEKYWIHINIVHNLSEFDLGECYVGIYNNPKECINGLRTKEYPTYQQAREQANFK